MIYDTSIYQDENIDYIYHIADIHIPNDNSRHPEYRSVFDSLYKKLKNNKKTKSLIVIAGDIIDKGDKITPDCIKLTKEFLENLSKIFPTIVIAGNHDDNVRGNSTKTDSITAILKDNQYPNLHYLNKTAIYNLGTNIALGVITVFNETMIDVNDFPKDRTKIGIYHGMVEGLTPEQNHNIPTGNYKFTSNDFKDYDMVLLGDIHKHYYLNDEKTIAYSGSLIQQSHGEHLNNHGGCIKWDLNKNTSTFLPIHNDYGFITLTYQNGKLNIPESYPKISRIRVKYLDSDYIDTNTINEKIKLLMPNTKNEALKIEYCNSNNNQVISNYINDEDLFRSYLNSTNYNELKKEKIIEIHNGFIKDLQKDEVISKSIWKLRYLKFKNILCYKTQQEIDFTKLCSIDNLWGILGKNAQGKSSILKIIIFALFGKIPDTPQPDIVNKKSKNKTINCEIQFSLLDVEYKITRTLSTVKLFKKIIDWQDISESNKTETEKQIINIIGDSDILLNTNISLQEQHGNLFNLQNKNQLDIVKKILSLDIYDKINAQVKNILKLLESDSNELIKEYQEEKDIISTKEFKLTEYKDLGIQKDKLDLLIENDNKKNEFIKLNKKIQHLNKNMIKPKQIYTQKDYNDLGIQIDKIETEKDDLLTKIVPIDPKLLKFNKTRNQDKIHSLTKKRDNLNNILNKINITTSEKELRNQRNLLTQSLKSENLSNLKDIIEETKKLKKNKKDLGILKKKIKCVLEFLKSNSQKQFEKIKSEYLNYQDIYKKYTKAQVNLENITQLYDSKLLLIKEDNFLYDDSCPKCLHNKKCSGRTKLDKELQDTLDKKNKREKKYLGLQDQINEMKYIEEEYQEMINLEKEIVLKENEKNKFENKIDKLNIDIEKLDIIIQNYNENQRNIEYNKGIKEEIKDLGTLIEEIEKKNQIELEVQKLNLDIDKLSIELEKYQLVEQQIIENKKINKKINKIKENLGNLNNKYAEILDSINDYENNLILLANQEKELEELNQDIEILGYDANLDSHNLNKRLQKVYGDLGIVKQDLDYINTLTEGIKEKEDKIKNYKLELDYYTSYQNITNWKGYPIFLIKKKLTILENQINRILSVSAHFKCKVVLDKKNNKKQNTDYTLIFYSIINNEKVPIKNCSGFERFILSIAIRMGLITISNYMTPNFFIIDEGFGTMDHKNQNNITDLFDNLKSQFELIFVITHIDELKQKIKNKLVIENYKIK